ncbi:signal peptidase II [Candidatus Woesearchaeota archaeon CG10_big_fil_rev_8_21_14_0_10_34_8]|nr:MAG: signal peptidase II [Candidatus Woesearchaeota archaeon CG10_big_fil_rev_8_21_14_0_10_34_8]
MKRITLPTTIFILIAALVILLDQITKYLVRVTFPLGTTYKIFSIINITHTTNSGASFSILTSYSFLLAVIAVFVILAIVIFYRKIPDNYRLPFALILGGTAGNLIDRICFGQVTDFINIKIWPIFNLADAAITLAAVLLIITVWKEK